MSHQSVKSQLTKLCRNQLGIAHLGLILAVVSVAGIIGLGAYSVLNKPNPNDSLQAITAIDKATQELGLQGMFKPGVDQTQFADLMKNANLDNVQDANDLLEKNPKIKALFKFDGERNGTPNAVIITSVLNQQLFASGALKTKAKTTKSGTNDDQLQTGIKPASGTPAKPSGNRTGNSPSADSVSRPPSDRDDESNLQDEENNTVGDSRQDETDRWSEFCNERHRSVSGNGCGGCNESEYPYLENASTSGWNYCVKKCPNGLISGTRTCQRNGPDSSTISEAKCNQLGRRYESGQCKRECTGKNGHNYLTDYSNGNAFDKCVNKPENCPNSKGPGWAIKAGQCAPQNQKKPSTTPPNGPGSSKDPIKLSCAQAKSKGIPFKSDYFCPVTDNGHRTHESACKKSGGAVLTNFTFKSSKDELYYTLATVCTKKKVEDKNTACKEVRSQLAQRGYSCPTVRNNALDHCPANTIDVKNYRLSNGGKIYELPLVCKYDWKNFCVNLLHREYRDNGCAAFGSNSVGCVRGYVVGNISTKGPDGKTWRGCVKKEDSKPRESDWQKFCLGIHREYRKDGCAANGNDKNCVSGYVESKTTSAGPGGKRWYVCVKAKKDEKSKEDDKPTAKPKLLSCPDYKSKRKSGDSARCAYKIHIRNKSVLSCDGRTAASKAKDGTKKSGTDKSGNPIYTETACKSGGR